MNRNPAVVFDACVLYPAPLRDLLVELSGLAQDRDWFRAKWTTEIHEEWIRNLLENRPDLTREQLTRTRQLMDRYIDDCLVTGYEHRIASLTLPDENDRHVLATAIECGASIIVTANVTDFPAAALVASGIVAMTADQFIIDLLDTHEEAGEKVLEEAVRSIKSRLKKPPRCWNQYLHCLETMEGNELINTVARLRTIISKDEVLSDDPPGWRWKHLVAVDHEWKKQLHALGRKLPASTVWVAMQANKLTKDQAVENWDLPLSAIDEIIEYCEANKELLENEAAEERRRLEEKGIKIDDVEDSHQAEAVLERIIAGKEAIQSSASVRKELGLND